MAGRATAESRERNSSFCEGGVAFPLHCPEVIGPESTRGGKYTEYVEQARWMEKGQDGKVLGA